MTSGVYDGGTRKYNFKNASHLHKKENLKVNKKLTGRIDANIDALRKWCSFVKAYPDLFLDQLKSENSIDLYFYQRLFLRAAIRHKYMFATFSRGYSKSFLNILVLVLKCIFFPGIKIAIVSEGKEQASKIAKEKIDEILYYWPALKNEIKERKNEKDYVKITFKNESYLDILAIQNSSRGSRRNMVLVDEAILVDGELLQSVIIPTLNVDRQARNGKIDENELHKSQCYISSAGFKNSFAYQQMISILLRMMFNDDAFCWGGDYNIPILYGLLSKNTIQDLKDQGTYDDLLFSREYGSKWSGTSADAFFNGDVFDKHRKLKLPEFEPYKSSSKKDIKYIISVDVARTAKKRGAGTEIVVIKLIPQKNGTYVKEIVNIFSTHGEHFDDQACKIKKIVQDFNAIQLVVDGNGVGFGLIDALVKENIDKNTGEIFPPYSVTNDTDYDKFITHESIPVLFNLKSTGSLASRIHANCLAQISSGKVNFLIDEMGAKAELDILKEKMDLNEVEISKWKAPYMLTTLLKEEMLNLQRKSEGNNIILKQMTQMVPKDKFSAVEYGLWYIKTLEDENAGRLVDVDLTDFLLIRKPKWKTTYGR